MGRHFLGAKDLGLETDWRFEFTGMGEHAEPTPGVVYLDVGGSIQNGILDHHASSGEFECTAQLVLARREAVYNHLLGDLLRARCSGIDLHGKWSPTIVTHHEPDWDSLVACHLAMCLVEDGQFPPYANALADYTREVDQGRYMVDLDREDSIYVPHIAYLAVQNLKDTTGHALPSKEQLRRGLELVRRIVGAIPNWHPGGLEANAWINDPWFADIVALLQSDRDRFLRDRKRARILSSRVPAADGGRPLEVLAFIAQIPMESILHKYWVRASGFPLFICPSEAPPGSEVYSRVIISIDPNYGVEGRRPNLHGLGYALEQAETARRRSEHRGVDDRGGSPRFPGGYCANADPWYDGRDFQHTIVDSPRAKTHLPYADIVRIATCTPFWETPVRHASVSLIFCDCGSLDPHLKFHKLQMHPASAATMEAYYAECRAASAPTGFDDFSLPEGLSLSCTIRKFPSGTCPPLRILTISGASGGTLEGLIAARQKLIEQVGIPPDYSLARLVVAAHTLQPERIGRLLRELGDGEVHEIGPLSEGGRIVLFNSRTVILKDPEPAAKGEPDLEEEALLYVAFLNETLVNFSKRISDLLPSDGGAPDVGSTETLCREFLRFQARYYQIEVVREAQGRVLLEHLAESLNLTEDYAEVRSELDRLAQLQAQLADERRARSDRLLQLVLYFVAVTGVFQTLLAFWGAGGTLRSPVFWCTVTVVVALGIFFFHRIARGYWGRKPRGLARPGDREVAK